VRSIGPDLAVLHYNAGVLHYDAEGRLQPRTLDDESVESLSADMTVNVTSALAAVREARALMAPRGAGTILLTGGGLGVEPSPAFLTLSVGKSALRAAAKSLFEPLRAQGVHIATVTVSTLVGPGSPQAEQVADTFWRLHDQAKDRWTWEAVYA
jgi:short-subunit dehydrogenase